MAVDESDEDEDMSEPVSRSSPDGFVGETEREAGLLRFWRAGGPLAACKRRRRRRGGGLIKASVAVVPDGRPADGGGPLYTGPRRPIRASFDGGEALDRLFPCHFEFFSSIFPFGPVIPGASSGSVAPTVTWCRWMLRR